MGVKRLLTKFSGNSKHHFSIKVADFRCLDVCAKHCSALSESLATNTSLQELYLGETDSIGNDDVVNIADALSTHRSLTSISLSGTKLSDDGLTSLAVSCIEENQRLKHLTLSGASISDKGAEWIAESLRMNTSLKTLTLRRNDITATGAIALGRSLNPIGSNDTLERLDLGQNPVEVQGWAFLIENSIDIFIGDAPVPRCRDDGCDDLSDAIASNTNLEHLCPSTMALLTMLLKPSMGHCTITPADQPRCGR